MNAQYLIEVLKQLDPDTVIMLWDAEEGASKAIDCIEVDEDGDVVIY